MKAYKIELLVIDFDELGKDEIVEQIESVRYPNDCIGPLVKKVIGVDIGEWYDNHPLNLRATSQEEYKRIFGE